MIRDLLAHGYQVLSLDKVPPREKLCTSWLADLRQSGDLFEALKDAYGIIHLGAYQAPNLAPDAETLSNNVSATYNVLRAAADLKVKKVVIASSTAAFGFIYAKKLWAPEYLPLDEDHPSTPQDSYGLSKVLGEQIADSIVSIHEDMTVSSLRFPGVNFDLSYESFRERWRNPPARTSGFWTYIDARDAATTCRLALEAKFRGHEVFIASAPQKLHDPTDCWNWLKNICRRARRSKKSPAHIGAAWIPAKRDACSDSNRHIFGRTISRKEKRRYSQSPEFRPGECERYHGADASHSHKERDVWLSRLTPRRQFN